MRIRTAYKRAQWKSRVADIKTQFVSGPKLSDAVTVFLTTVKRAPYQCFLMNLPRFHGLVFQ
jgi:hypothetical protein